VDKVRLMAEVRCGWGVDRSECLAGDEVCLGCGLGWGVGVHMCGWDAIMRLRWEWGVGP